ncbi:MAG: ABC-F family ATP-binding cassette domain-containing protein [Eubacteriaceae bacterium]
MLINIENLHFSYGIHDIIKNLNLSIDEREQIGLVGRNGSGKSTFLKLLTGELIPDSGYIHKKNNLTMAYLAQETNVPIDTTLQELLTSVFKDVIEMESQINALGVKISKTTGEIQKKHIANYGELQEAFHRLHGYEYPSRIRGILSGLGFVEADLEKSFSVLSGGEKTRAMLGQILLREPQLILLDEPTNYLDISALQWLEQYLKAYTGSFIIISHDRYFLDKVCSRILDVTSKMTIKSYQGNYTDYIHKKQLETKEQEHQFNQQQNEINKQKEVISRFRAYNSIKSSKRALSREKALEKIELIEKEGYSRQVKFSFTPKVQSGKEVLVCENVSKNFNDLKLFSNISLEVRLGDKIGIIGANGIGKTTLFNILEGSLSPDSGEIRFGHKVNLGYFDQEHNDLKHFYSENLLEALWDIDSTLNEGELRNILGAFLFSGEDVFKSIATLSGGEKARLLLARLMISNANFLMMDEPTNHIDMDTKEILENALTHYEGTLLFISHDRYFLNRIANKIFLFTPNGIEVHLGNYDDYLKNKAKEKEREGLELEANKVVVTKTQQKIERKKQNEILSKIRSLKREIKEIEENIITIEKEIDCIEEKMCLPNFYDDLQLATKMNQDYENLKNEISKLTDHWENLSLELEEFSETY